MRKVFLFLILVILSLSLFSCENDKFIYTDDDDSITNFLGASFTVYTNGSWLSDKRERGDSASSDRFIDRIEVIETTYNLKIKNECHSLESKILAMTLNGGGGCDLLYCIDSTLYSFFNLGILTPFEDIGVKDHQNIKFGIPSLLYEGNFNGTQYGIVNYLGDSVPPINGLITVNMNLVNDLGINDPHEYVERGEWNWDNFRIVLEQGTVDDGEIKHVGMLSEWTVAGVKTFLPAILANNGYLIKEINGIYRSGLNESNTIEAIEFMMELVNDELIQVAGGSVWDVYVEGKIWPFSNGLGWSSDEIGTFSKKINGIGWSIDDTEYSLVRFPYGPNGNKDVVAAYSMFRDYYAFTILSSFSNEDIGLIIDDLFEPLDANLYPEGWKDYSVDNLFFDDSDYETYMAGLDALTYYPLAKLYGTNPWTHKGPVEDALGNIVAGHGTVQSEIDSIQTLFTDIINEKLNGIK